MTSPPKRKKWTEAEERTLIDRYREMVCDGTLAKMKTREKKYKPIALYVNSIHYGRNPITYPWQWTWKDVSTKVQNMRNQYTLVKQKIKKSESSGEMGEEKFDWMEGLTHWSNFLRYKEVFGDVELVSNSNDSLIVADVNDETGGGFDGSDRGMDITAFGHLGQAGDGDFGAGLDGVDNGVMGLEFDYDGEEGDGNYKGENNSHIKEDGDDGFVYEDIDPSGSYSKKKRRIFKGWACGFLANQLGQLREMESRFELREAEREQERRRREELWMEMQLEHDRKWQEREKEREEMKKARDTLRRQQLQEWETMEKEWEERERRRSGEELIYEREWEERVNRKRSEWKRRIDETLSQHHEEMGHMQTRILHEQQNITSQLLGIVSQWTGHPTGLSDHTGASSHYLSQMMQNLHHVNDIIHGDTRVEGDNEEDQFIVDD